MRTRRQGREGHEQSRREFAAACLALGAGAAYAALPFNAPRFESTRFPSRTSMESVVAIVRAQFPAAILLDAIAAPHVPELLVIHGLQLAPNGVYEVRRYAEVMVSAESPDGLVLQHGSGCVQIFQHRSLSERAAQWGRDALRPAADEIGFYRVI